MAVTRRAFLILGALAGMAAKRRKPQAGVYADVYANAY